MPGFSLTYSIADQNFAKTNSIGMLNLSIDMLKHLAGRPEISKLTVLSNSTLSARVQLPASIPVQLYDTAINSMVGRARWGLSGVYSAAKRSGNDWLFLPKGFASFVRRCPVKLMSCIADTHLEHYNVYYPKVIPFHIRLHDHFSTAAAIQNSTIVFTISEFTRQEVFRFAEHYKLKTPQVRAIGIGFYPKSKPVLEKKNRILLLAGRWPHKRTDLAVRYMDAWQEKSNFKGTIEWVGKFPSDLRLPERPNWIYHSRMPDDAFYTLMSEAKVMIYFSGYEGFGMPPVEAAIAGTAPVYSDLPATREVMADAGYRFDNNSFESFDLALNKALLSSNDTIANWGKELLRRHNCEDVVSRILEEMEKVQHAEMVVA